MSSLFTRIIQGEIPCHKVYEDDRTLAFMDIYPVQPGMILVVSKTEVENFYELSDIDYQALWKTVKLIGQKLRDHYPNKKRIGIQVEGLDVPHVHVKLFPIDSDQQFRREPDVSVEPDHQALAQLASQLSMLP